ncbi:MAG: glucose-6-phosphate isomerase [Elusimicrobiota bacterium]|jgi:glucose-6-phosphate isomerase|nr:glucose-6-phosphate isomerase [Elusimicrobiota bacterium]
MKITANNAAQTLINEGLQKLDSLNFTQKLYAHDGTLWKQDSESVNFINGFLGWTEIYNWTLEQLPQIQSFAQEVRPLFGDIVLMGMGGSSLAPEVLRRLSGPREGWPRLLVLDSTNPGRVASVRAQINPARTLFIFASKSGGTVEPASQFAYFYEEVSKVSQNPGANFIAITDAGTGLETLAKEKKFRRVFINPADIGGRFSALSLFGAVPAVLSGFDAEGMLKSAAAAGEVFKTSQNNAAASLGALMGAAFARGRDKLTLLMPSHIASFGLWIEQLVAESTGKEGKGIVPVAGEALHKNFTYNNDRVFVYISCEGTDNEAVKEAAAALAKTGHPVFEVQMDGPCDIGAQFLLWEVATAAAGALMQINPFDQPNVQLAKTITKGLLADLEAGKKSAQTTAEFIASKNIAGSVGFDALGGDLYKLLGKHDYIALLAYLNETPETESVLYALRDKIFMRTKNAVLFGYGPRYLHSTGQLHKGDGNNGVFIVLTEEAEEDIKIPAQKYGFEALCNAQALADFKALEEKGRRAVKLHLNKPAARALAELSKKF